MSHTSTWAFGGLILAAVAAAPALEVGGPAPAARLTAREASQTFGGACVAADDPVNCPATAVTCVGNCGGKKAGDPCAGQSYSQANPTYRKTKDADAGKKLAKESTLLCGNSIRCGPACMNTAMMGIICPNASLPDYVTEKFPDEDSGDCAEEQAGQSQAAFAPAGGGRIAAGVLSFDAFTLR